jgi:phosphatidate cytidylyltransferase
MQRILTALVGTPIILLALFKLPGWWWFALMAFFIDWAAYEYLAIVRPRARRAPLTVLLVLAPLGAYALSVALSGEPHAPDTLDVQLHLMAWALVLSVGLGTLLLLSRTPLEETLPALGILGFGIPYFALPIAAIHRLQVISPWVVLLLMGIVWIGDTAAYYVGSRFGRHKMAPTISPKKSWEGAAASLAAALAATAVWSAWKLDRVDLGLLAVAAGTAVAAQIGDLVESMIKRGTGVKDSGNVLPGHGGLLDRLDAMLFAAPVLLFGIWLFRLDVVPK